MHAICLRTISSNTRQHAHASARRASVPGAPRRTATGLTRMSSLRSPEIGERVPDILPRGRGARVTRVGRGHAGRGYVSLVSLFSIDQSGHSALQTCEEQSCRRCGAYFDTGGRQFRYDQCEPLLNTGTCRRGRRCRCLEPTSTAKLQLLQLCSFAAAGAATIFGTMGRDHGSGIKLQQPQLGPWSRIWLLSGFGLLSPAGERPRARAAAGARGDRRHLPREERTLLYRRAYNSSYNSPFK